MAEHALEERLEHEARNDDRCETDKSRQGESVAPKALPHELAAGRWACKNTAL
jgi:hypothetical protein